MNAYLKRKRDAILRGGLWYLLSGLTTSDIIAAYQFKDRASWNEAKNTVAGLASYPLDAVVGG